MTFLQILTLLAGMMLGEAGVLSDDAAKAIGHVAINRVASARFPNTYSAVIEQGFYGWKKPTDRYVRLAYTLFAEPDSTGGCLFALSKQDVQLLQFPPGDIVYGTGKYQLHLYREWPDRVDYIQPKR